MRDPSLEDAFARRSPAGYAGAYERYGRRMYATALHLLGDREVASECVHDVFLHLWRKPTGYVVERGSLEAFLVTCVRNRALMQLRQAGRGRAAVSKLDPPAGYELQDDPIERDRIARAIAQLSDPQADVIRLAYFRGLTLNEVASDLAIPVGTVKGRLSAALTALRRSLRVEGGNEI